jgi:small ligand-binding sensory domain FIST
MNATHSAHARAIVARNDNWRIALEEALHGIFEGRRSRPDLLVMFASSAYSDHYPEMVREAYYGSQAGCLVGCSARGVIAGEDSREAEPGISMLALWLPGADLVPVRLHQEMQDTLADPMLWFDLHDLHPEDVNGWIVFAEPYRMDAQEAVKNLRSRYPGTPMVGALASTTRADRRMWIFIDDHVYDEGGVALALRGPYRMEVIVSQGGEPVGQPWTITGVDKNRITTISNRPALEVLKETLASLGEEGTDDPPILIGFPMTEYQDEFKRGDFVVRGLLGIDEETGSLLVGSIPRIGQTVQFHLRDPKAATLDEERMLADLRRQLGDSDTTIAGLVCTCKGRGRAMFGAEDHDARALREVFPALPIAGLFSLGEIGPVRGVPALNGFAMSFAIITQKPDDPKAQ